LGVGGREGERAWYDRGRGEINGGRAMVESGYLEKKFSMHS